MPLQYFHGVSTKHLQVKPGRGFCASVLSDLKHVYSHLEMLCFEMKMVLMFNISLAHMHTCLSKLTCKYMCIYMKCVTSVGFSLSHVW